MDMDNGVGTDYESRGQAGWRELNGGKWHNCNSINNKIFKKERKRKPSDPIAGISPPFH